MKKEIKLKRFVLLDNNEIIDTNNKYEECPEKWEMPDNYVCYLDYPKENALIGGLICTLSIDMNRVKKTSDNILDLLEVGDLAGTLFTIGKETELRVQQVMNLNKPDRIHFHGGEVFKRDIVCIYKLKKNGDYTRYEVIDDGK
ncbi:hypothetical protein BK011_06770 [Tenericutes bacterium MZ-XQ]|nr:hypothetical protein BK011_06770 [Tenericutes bacterium MZ-XQ]